MGSKRDGDLSDTQNKLKHVDRNLPPMEYGNELSYSVYYKQLLQDGTLMVNSLF